MNKDSKECFWEILSEPFNKNCRLCVHKSVCWDQGMSGCGWKAKEGQTPMYMYKWKGNYEYGILDE